MIRTADIPDLPDRFAAILAAIALALLLVACNRGHGEAPPPLEPTPTTASLPTATGSTTLSPSDGATAVTATMAPAGATQTLAPQAETPQPQAAPSDSSLPVATDTPAPTSQENIELPRPVIDLASGIPVYGYEVVNVYPHDPGAFTQGLIVEGETLIEGTGLYGQSSLREVDLRSGRVAEWIPLPEELFGEGVTVFEDRILQLTWHGQQAFIYDADTFEPLGTFGYPTEGWGITHDSERLIMSDGSATLYFRDPATFAEKGRVEVRDVNGPLVWLNELEYVEGEVWANIWQTDTIARIDPATGNVVGWIDLTGLLSADERQPGGVANGIAYDDETDRLFVTGKWWPKLFEIRLVPAGK